MFLQFILLLITLLVIKSFIRNRKPPGTPPGTNGLPLFGTLPSRNETFEHFVETLRKKHGDIIWLKLGENENVILCKYEDIITAFNNPAIQGRSMFYSSHLFYRYGERDPKRRQDTLHEILGIANSQGNRWQNVRRFVIRRLRDGGMGKSSMEAIILREAEALAEDFEKNVGKPTEVPWSVNASIFNVIWRLVGDRRYDIFDEHIQLMCNNLNDLLSIMQKNLFYFDALPSLLRFTPNFIVNYMGKKEFDDKIERIYDLMHKAVDEHKKTLDEDNPRDLIDSYLIELKNVESDSPHKSEHCLTFSEQELVNSIFDLFLAGSETTSSTIRWFILFMAKYPEIQKKIQEEIDNIIQSDKPVSLEYKDRLPYFEACVHETLRLKPILPLGLPHAATEDTMLGEYFIPKGTQVTPNIIYCHKDIRFWEKPLEFYPEHFLNDDGTFNKKKEGLLTFSIGRRVCIGENLARMDLFIVLVTLMKKFTFTVPEGEILSDEVFPDQPFFTVPKPFKILINKR